MAELNDLGVVLLKAVVVDDLKKQLVGDSNPIPSVEIFERRLTLVLKFLLYDRPTTASTPTLPVTVSLLRSMLRSDSIENALADLVEFGGTVERFPRSFGENFAKVAKIIACPQDVAVVEKVLETCLIVGLRDWFHETEFASQISNALEKVKTSCSADIINALNAVVEKQVENMRSVAFAVISHCHGILMQQGFPDAVATELAWAVVRDIGINLEPDRFNTPVSVLSVSTEGFLQEHPLTDVGQTLCGVKTYSATDLRPNYMQLGKHSVIFKGRSGAILFIPSHSNEQELIAYLRKTQMRQLALVGNIDLPQNIKTSVASDSNRIKRSIDRTQRATSIKIISEVGDGVALKIGDQSPIQLTIKNEQIDLKINLIQFACTLYDRFNLPIQFVLDHSEHTIATANYVEAVISLDFQSRAHRRESDVLAAPSKAPLLQLSPADLLFIAVAESLGVLTHQIPRNEAITELLELRNRFDAELQPGTDLVSVFEANPITFVLGIMAQYQDIIKVYAALSDPSHSQELLRHGERAFTARTSSASSKP